MDKSKSKSKLVNVITLLLGFVVGCALNVTGNVEFSNTFFAPLGSLYVSMLQFVALPMVFCIVIVSITSQPSIRKIVSLVYKTIICDILSAALIGVIAFFVSAFFVAREFLTLAPTVLASKHLSFAQNHVNKLITTVPSEIIAKFMREHLFFVLIAAIFLGFLMVYKKEKFDPLARMIISINSVLKEMLGIIVRFAPIGIFSVTANAFASNDLAVVKNLFGLVCMTFVVAIVYILLTTTIVAIATKNSFYACVRAEFSPLFFGFVTSSSPACIPLAQKCADDLGCKKEISSFVVPLTNLLIKAGSTMNIYCMVAFVITASGTVMSLTRWIFMILLAMCCALAVPAIPLGTIFVIPTALSFLNIIADNNLMGLLFTVYTFLDMLATAVSCQSNVFCAVLVDKINLRKRKTKFLSEEIQ
ncbi:MAG: cation:dicarboxylase symporter family transporter [Synergistaceae bacterium]|nr:cation:dicarboxylase symporter family transporter [Synergistaceae bacterium]